MLIRSILGLILMLALPMAASADPSPVLRGLGTGVLYAKYTARYSCTVVNHGQYATNVTVMLKDETGAVAIDPLTQQPATLTVVGLPSNQAAMLVKPAAFAGERLYCWADVPVNAVVAGNLIVRDLTGNTMASAVLSEDVHGLLEEILGALSDAPYTGVARSLATGKIDAKYVYRYACSVVNKNELGDIEGTIMLKDAAGVVAVNPLNQQPATLSFVDLEPGEAAVLEKPAAFTGESLYCWVSVPAYSTVFGNLTVFDSMKNSTASTPLTEDVNGLVTEILDAISEPCGGCSGF